MSRDPAGEDYPHYVFKYNISFPRSMRWGHAHPTWTFHALPFLGEMYIRVITKSTYPSFYSDEDVANLMSWEWKLTKQWCKWDNFLHMLEPFLSQSPTAFSPGDMADKKWYREGVPMVFTSMHDAKKWDVTLAAIDRVIKVDGKSKSAYFWKSKWYADPDALLAQNPPCVV